MTIPELFLTRLYSQVRSLYIQHSTKPQLRILHLLWRIQEVLFCLSEDSDLLTYFVVLFKVLDYVHLCEGWGTNTVED